MIYVMSAWDGKLDGVSGRFVFTEIDTAAAFFNDKFDEP